MTDPALAESHHDAEASSGVTRFSQPAPNLLCRILKFRRLSCTGPMSVFSALLFMMTLGACAEGEKYKEGDIRAMAQRFYDAAAAMDTRRFLDLVAYPFRFDDKLIADESTMRSALESKWRQVNARVQTAGFLHSISYEDFINGKEFMGVSLKEDKARDQAKRINFVPGSLLVRCYYADKETGREDGRGYFLVMQNTDTGLRIISYYD